MSRPCSLCDSPHSREITRRLKAGQPHDDVVLYLGSVGVNVHRTTVGRHARHVLPDAAPRRTGPRPVSTDLLELVRDRVVVDVEDGRLSPTITHGLHAQAQLDARSARQSDRDLMARIALALTGHLSAPVLARVLDPEEAAWEEEREALEAELRPLLGDGSEGAANPRRSATDRRAELQDR